MSLTLYYHPLGSFCHKVLIALYENEMPFAAEIVDLGNAEARARFLDLWPVGKIPIPRDEARPWFERFPHRAIMPARFRAVMLRDLRS